MKTQVDLEGLHPPSSPKVPTAERSVGRQRGASQDAPRSLLAFSRAQPATKEVGGRDESHSHIEEFARIAYTAR